MECWPILQNQYLYVHKVKSVNTSVVCSVFIHHTLYSKEEYIWLPRIFMFVPIEYLLIGQRAVTRYEKKVETIRTWS